MQTSKNLLNIIKNFLDNEKVEDIVILNLKDKTALADYMIIATAISGKHVGAVAGKLEEELKKNHQITPLSIEGTTKGDWGILDYNDVVVHLFRDEVREYYKLEDLWNKLINDRNEKIETEAE